MPSIEPSIRNTRTICLNGKNELGSHKPSEKDRKETEKMRRGSHKLYGMGTNCSPEKSHREAVAAVEFAFCLPVIVLLLLGLWEVGRIVQISNVLRNGAREAARDASLGQDNLSTVASNLASYVQGSLPATFVPGHSTTLKPPAISLPPNTTGYMCWDNTTSQELFTITFTDVTNPSLTDPTLMQKLDRFKMGIQVPYATIGWSGLAQITSVSRITFNVDWVSMRDAPFTITPALPAQ